MTAEDGARDAWAVGMWIAVAVFIGLFSLRLVLFWALDVFPRLSESVALLNGWLTYVEFGVRLVLVPATLVAAVLLYRGLRGGREILVVALGVDLLLLWRTGVGPGYGMLRLAQWLAFAALFALTWSRVKLATTGQPEMAEPRTGEDLFRPRAAGMLACFAMASVVGVLLVISVGSDSDPFELLRWGILAFGSVFLLAAVGAGLGFMAGEAWAWMLAAGLGAFMVFESMLFFVATGFWPSAALLTAGLAAVVVALLPYVRASCAAPPAVAVPG